MDRRIFHIVSQLSNGLGRQWAVVKMAEEVRMSVSQFRRLFKDQVGQTPVEFLNQLRLAKAHELLSDPKCFLQIKEIGASVGYVDKSRFTREFKSKYGLTPSEFRDQQAEIEQSKVKVLHK